MLTKDDLLQSLLAECDIAVHLFGKLPAGAMDYRPSENQRTTRELLQYLGFCGIGALSAMTDGNWDGYQAWAERLGKRSVDDFVSTMEEQKAALTEAFAQLTEDDMLRDATLPVGTVVSLERALMETALKWLVGYRMQLFLYAKAAGNDEIWTPDCWVGVSMPRDAAPAE
ncbi:MAG: hypothetical protein DRQ55_12780 [Planctomycetota bacterium]|nr:MAG: hypothetical protein DRQ55_12780 [Planctomycetota bacterium]